MICQSAVDAIRTGATALGIELGSTRIKAVLIDESHQVLATGAFSWENRLENGLWTYRLEDAVAGLQASFADLAANVQAKYGLPLATVGAMGISGMMHGYIALDANGKQLSPFLTWRNTNTGAAANALTELFQFNVPMRWSISHLYQMILSDAAHVPQIRALTTLAGDIHSLLTGNRVIGVGEASGMFPIDPATGSYDAVMLEKFSALIADRKYPWTTQEILPRVLSAGADAGCLTIDGAKLLDPTGTLQPGIPMVPPEGDAGTGMVATNAVAAGTGNVSAGTSIFSMVVLQKNLSKLYRDIDMVATPGGLPVAMVHCNNGSSELDAWMRMFREILEVSGGDTSNLYTDLFNKSLEGEADCGGILLYNYIAGEHITGVSEGRPLLVRKPESKLSLANFMRSQICGTMASLALGNRILQDEQVQIRQLTGHGGLFKTPGVAQRYLAAAMNSPVTVMTTAGEGGPYGMAVLAAYRAHAKDMPLESYLQNVVFRDAESVTVAPTEEEVAGFNRYLESYRKGLALEHCALDTIN